MSNGQSVNPQKIQLNVTDNISPVILIEILQTQAAILALADVLLDDEQINKFNEKVAKHFSDLNEKLFLNNPNLMK